MVFVEVNEDIDASIDGGEETGDIACALWK